DQLRDVDAQLVAEEGLAIRADRVGQGSPSLGQPAAIGWRQIVGRAGLVRETDDEVVRRSHVPLDPVAGARPAKIADGGARAGLGLAVARRATGPLRLGSNHVV